MENFLKASLATLATALLIIVAGVGQAKATPVTFSTTGSFNGGAFTSPASIVFGSDGNTLTLTFTGINPPATVNPAPFTFASLGTMNTSVTGTGATITPGT